MWEIMETKASWIFSITRKLIYHDYWLFYLVSITCELLENSDHHISTVKATVTNRKS